MDSTRFDALARAIAAPTTRRVTLRLLAAGLVGGLLRARAAGAAQGRPDTDGDGLYDDDELGVYGTDPNNWNTDGDFDGDGAEVYYGSDPLVPDVFASDGTGSADAASAGDTVSADQVGVADAQDCRGIGVPCDYDTQCCNAGMALCCWDGVMLRTECTYVAADGGACPY